MKRTLILRLHDILDAILGIEESVEDMTFSAYLKSWTTRRAVERGIEIISEASRHIPDSIKDKYPDIHWTEIAAIGNVLRHEYQRIEDAIIWETVKRYLPELKRTIKIIVEVDHRSD